MLSWKREAVMNGKTTFSSWLCNQNLLLSSLTFSGTQTTSSVQFFLFLPDWPTHHHTRYGEMGNKTFYWDDLINDFAKSWRISIVPLAFYRNLVAQVLFWIWDVACKEQLLLFKDQLLTKSVNHETETKIINKLMSLFRTCVLLLMMNFVRTFSM